MSDDTDALGLTIRDTTASTPTYPHLAICEPQPGAPATRLGVCVRCGRALPLARLQVALARFRYVQQRHPDQLLWRVVPLRCTDERACREAQMATQTRGRWGRV